MRKIELITCGVDQLEETKAQHPHAPVINHVQLIKERHTPSLPYPHDITVHCD